MGLPTVIATIGGATSNSYLTYAEANAYFSQRIPLNPPWLPQTYEYLLIMATRTLDALVQPFKTLFPGPPAYYRVRRQWTGDNATAVQRLAWPRVGMVDLNGTPLDIAITSCSVGNPSVATTTTPHYLTTGQEVLLYGVVGSTPDVNGPQIATVVDSTHFTIPVDVTVEGLGGTVTTIPQTLKEATAELAGQLLKEDRILDNDVLLQGIRSLRAGSVSITFKDDFVQQVIPQAVYDMMPYSWLTDELWIPANQAMFDVVSE